MLSELVSRVRLVSYVNRSEDVGMRLETIMVWHWWKHSSLAGVRGLNSCGKKDGGSDEENQGQFDTKIRHDRLGTSVTDACNRDSEWSQRYQDASVRIHTGYLDWDWNDQVQLIPNGAQFAFYGIKRSMAACFSGCLQKNSRSTAVIGVWNETGLVVLRCIPESFFHQSLNEHWAEVKRVLRYLSGTSNMGIM